MKVLWEKKNVRIVHGDIFATEYESIVIPVNLKCVMGAGLALKVRMKYPDVYQAYLIACQNGKININKLHVYENKLKKFIFFATKVSFKDSSQPSYIESGLNYFVENYHILDINSVAFPALGCGNGGLDFVYVAPLMYKYLSKCDIPCEIYVPLERTYNYINIDYNKLII